MKRLLAILLFAALLVQTCGQLVIFVNYEVNKKYITDKYCENKSNVALHCDGKCHLIKQLQKEEKQQNTPVKTQNTKLEIILFSQSLENQLFNVYVTGDCTYSIMPVARISSLPSAIFHPPSC